MVWMASAFKRVKREKVELVHYNSIVTELQDNCISTCKNLWKISIEISETKDRILWIMILIAFINRSNGLI